MPITHDSTRSSTGVGDHGEYWMIWTTLYRASACRISGGGTPAGGAAPCGAAVAGGASAGGAAGIGASVGGAAAGGAAATGEPASSFASAGGAVFVSAWGISSLPCAAGAAADAGGMPYECQSSKCMSWGKYHSMLGCLVLL